MGNAAGKGTLAGCWRWARQPSSNSLTSLAELNRRDGSFSSRRSTMAMNHGGNSGLSEAMACGESSTRRRMVAITESAAKRRNARRHLVEHAAQAEEIGTAIERFPPRLFGRHVLRRAGDDPPARKRDVVGRAGQAEVGEHGPFDAFFQQDVGGLHVAMHQALLVGRRQPGRGLHADAEGFLEFQAALGREPLGQRLPGHQRHDQERQPPVGLHLVDRQHVRMYDGGGRLGLAGEPLPRQRTLGQMRRQAP